MNAFCRPSRCVWALTLLSLLCSASALAQEAKVRTSLAVGSEVWVGQRVTWVVELLAPGYFSGAPAFDLPDPKGSLIVPPGESPTISAEEIEGANYTVQRHEFSVFARIAGQQTIPPLTARFHFKRNPLDTAVDSAAVKTDALSFTPQLPPGAEKLGFVICARDLEGVETWTPEPTNARAGDAFTRTITFAAPDVPAMLFPPFPEGRIDGLGIYPGPPEVRDYTERSEMTGERRDTITYVCMRPGQFQIPAVQLTWWDFGARQLRTVAFPARTLDVAENPGLAAAPVDGEVQGHWMAEVRRFRVLILAAVLTAGLLFGSRLFGGRVIAFFRPIHLSPLNPVEAWGSNGAEKPLRRCGPEGAASRLERGPFCDKAETI
jgi:hypothetical protein